MAASKKRSRPAAKVATESTKKRYERICKCCGHDFGTEGVLPYRACIHWEGGEYLVTCSGECRQELGLKTHRAVELRTLFGGTRT